MDGIHLHIIALKSNIQACILVKVRIPYPGWCTSSFATLQSLRDLYIKNHFSCLRKFKYLKGVVIFCIQRMSVSFRVQWCIMGDMISGMDACHSYWMVLIWCVIVIIFVLIFYFKPAWSSKGPDRWWPIWSWSDYLPKKIHRMLKSTGSIVKIVQKYKKNIAPLTISDHSICKRGWAYPSPCISHRQSTSWNIAPYDICDEQIFAQA